jgi:hypothetical protein
MAMNEKLGDLDMTAVVRLFGKNLTFSPSLLVRMHNDPHRHRRRLGNRCTEPASIKKTMITRTS